MSYRLPYMQPGCYTITQLCREFGTTARTLRFYEELGLLSPDRRDMSRIYTQKDRARVQLILRGRRVGLTLAEIGDILDLYDEGEDVQSAEALQVFRRRIEALEAERRRVEDAIASLKAASQRLAERFPAAAAAASPPHQAAAKTNRAYNR